MTDRVKVRGLAVALAAALTLVLLPPRPDARPRTPAVARAQRGEIPGHLRDGPLYTPGLFLDARASIGTAPTPQGDELRLVLRGADGGFTEVRRLTFDDNPVFDAFTTDGTTIAWTESSTARTEDGRVTTAVWAADVRTGRARRLTTDTGRYLGYGSAYDLVIAAGRVHWAAAAGTGRTEIRSVPLAGGPVGVSTQDGVWTLSAWPWLVDGAGDRTGATTLRNLVTGRDVEVRVSGAELATCGPVWCRVLVVEAGGRARIDEMRPDGGDRRRIAGAEATAALTDAALTDRFEVLGRPGPDAGLTGSEALVVHDLTDGTTTPLTPAATSTHARNGVVWWSTGDEDDLTWHTIVLAGLR